MRTIIITLLLCIPVALSAQSKWETPQSSNEPEATATKEYQYAKYLGPVVPEVDGEVKWEKTFTNNADAMTNYNTMVEFLTAMTKEEDQLEKSKVSIVNKEERKVVCHFEEWMTFAKKALVLDRTRFIYTLLAECEGNKVKVTIFRINYWYEEQRDGGEHFKAEEWITDKWGLNKKRTRLAKISGKFRRKTVDRVEEIYNNIAQCLSAQ